MPIRILMVAPATDKSRARQVRPGHLVEGEERAWQEPWEVGGGNDGSFGYKGSSVGGARAWRRS